MFQKGIMIFLLLTLFWTIKTSFATHNIKYKGRKDNKLKAEYVSGEIRAASHAQCLAYCSERQGCISTSFKSSAENCLLSEEDGIGESGRSPSTPKALEIATGWRTMTQIIYPVFHVLGDYERYSMTFEQAKQQCIEYGTTIATPSDLLEARSMGYGMCACSWMSDGTIGFVIQPPGCSHYSEGIVRCSNSVTANVFCKLK